MIICIYYRNPRTYKETNEENIYHQERREDQLGRVTRRRRKRNVLYDEEPNTIENETFYPTKYQKLILSSKPCSTRPSHDKDETNSGHMGQDQHFSSDLLRDNVFRPPYDHTNLEWGENGISSEQRFLSRPLDWEKNVEFLRNSAEKLSPKYVSTWSTNRVAYFVSSLPGISYNSSTLRNGVANEIGK